MNKMKETKQVFNLMIESAQNQEKEIDPSSENEEEKNNKFHIEVFSSLQIIMN